MQLQIAFQDNQQISLADLTEVGLFELMTALETPDIQKQIVRGQVTDRTICQVHPVKSELR